MFSILSFIVGVIVGTIMYHSIEAVRNAYAYISSKLKKKVRYD